MNKIKRSVNYEILLAHKVFRVIHLLITICNVTKNRC